MYNTIDVFYYIILYRNALQSGTGWGGSIARPSLICEPV